MSSHRRLLRAQVLQIPAGSRKFRFKMENMWDRSNLCFLYVVLFIVYLIGPGLSAENKWRPQHSYAFELKNLFYPTMFTAEIIFFRSVARYAIYDHINKEMRTKYMQLNGTTAKYTCMRIHLLRMNNTPTHTFGHEQIPTGRIIVSRRNKRWRDHTHEEGTSLHGMLLPKMMMILITCRNSHLKPWKEDIRQ
jgi:hypothetical protein